MRGRRGRIWVAVQVGEERSVHPCDRIDAQGLDTHAAVPLEEGMPIVVTLRSGSASRRTLDVPVRVQRIEGRIKEGGTAAVRLSFERTPPALVHEVAVLAEAHGLWHGPMPAPPPREASKPAASSAAAPGPIRGTALGESAAWVLRFPSAGERAALAARILTEGLFVETAEPPPVNTRLLLRLDHPGGRPVYLEARVNLVSNGEDGGSRVALGVERIPSIVADALRRE